MPIHSLLKNLKSFHPPSDDFVIVSSGALAIRGIREAKDLDVVVTRVLWDELIKTHAAEVNESGVERISLDKDIEILHPAQSIFGNSKIIPLQEILNEADIFEGVKFINLKHLKEIKLKLGREKDLRDIELIDEYLASGKH